MHFCKGVRSQADAPSGMRFVGLSENGTWGIFVTSDTSQGVQAFPAHRIKPVPRQQDKQHLTARERAHYYGLLNEQLALDETASEWATFIKMLDPAALEFFGFKSYQRGQTVTGLHPLLPGVNPTTPTALIPARGGLLIPFKDIEGGILGYQYTPQARIEAENAGLEYVGAKYFWFSSGKEGGGVPRLPAPIDELPLGHFVPRAPIDPTTLYLCEGGIKSALAAWWMRWHVLATANAGNHAGRQLGDLLASGQFKRVVLVPDAGMTTNPGISTAYHKTAKQVEGAGIPLRVAWWGQATKPIGDIDDLIVAGNHGAIQEITFDEYFSKHPAEIQRDLDGGRKRQSVHWVATKGNEPQPQTANLETVRSDLRRAISGAINATMLRPGHLHLMQYPTGAGKTTALVDALKELKATGTLQNRVLVLTKSRENAEALQSQLGNAAFYFQGRTEEVGSDFRCMKLAEYNRLASQRHNAGAEFCSGCHDDLKAIHWPCRYKDSEKTARGYQIVIAVYASFLNDSDRLDDFDLVVVDEDITEAGLVEDVLFSQHDLTTFRGLIADNPDCSALYPVNSPLWPLFEALQSMLSLGAGLPSGSATDAGKEWERLVQCVQLRSLYDSEGIGANGCSSFRFEKIHYLDHNKVAKRVLVDLLESLTDGRGRAIVTRNGIRFTRTNNAYRLLKTKTVISLDATPQTALLMDAWGQENVTVSGQESLTPNVRITQIIGAVYNTATLNRDPNKLRELEAMGNHAASLFSSPVVVMPKAFCGRAYEGDEAKPPQPEQLISINHANAKTIWFGGQTRASNEFIGADGVVILGNFQHPPDGVRLKVNALRTSRPYGDAGASTEELRPFHIVGATDTVPARKQWTSPDPLVQSVIDRAIAAEIAQAIGRARPLSMDKPLDVVIVNGWAIDGIPIHQAIHKRDLLGAIKGNCPLNYLNNVQPKSTTIRGAETQSYQESARKHGGCIYINIKQPSENLADCLYISNLGIHNGVPLNHKAYPHNGKVNNSTRSP